jgi:hypothetical protein
VNIGPDVLALAVVGIGALAWLRARGTALRAFGAARDPESRAATSWVLAGSAGAASVGATAAAVELGGPGALVWLWLGMLLAFAVLPWAARAATPEGPAASQPASPVRGGVTVIVGVLGVGALAGQTLAAARPEIIGAEPGAIIAGALAAALALAGSMRRAWGERLVKIAPALLLLVLLMSAFAVVEAGRLGLAIDAVIAGAGDFERGRSTALGSILAVVVGAGLGHAVLLLPGAGALMRQHAPGRPRAALGALVAGLTLSLAVGLAMVSTRVDPDALRLDDLELRKAAPDGSEVAAMLPVERAHARAFLPSPRGQTVVLPPDTPLQPDMEYTLRFRANPRGYAMGVGSENRNALAVPMAPFTENAHTLLFRDPTRKDDASWDWRIETTSEVLDIGGGNKVVQMIPKDPSVDLAELAKDLDGPYVVVDDPLVTGRTGRATATSKAIGDHLAFYAVRDPQGFDLERLIRMGVRGPFLDVDRPRAPWAFVARDDLHEHAEIGDRIPVRLMPPARGVATARLLKNGELETPAWRSIEGVRLVRMRHDEDPTQDFFIPVTPYVADGSLNLVRGRLRFSDAEDAEITMREASRQKGYSGPFLEMAPVDLVVEVRSASQLSDRPQTELAQRGNLASPWAETRRVLVPVGVAAEPMGGDGGLYDAHPGQLLSVGMTGPFEHRAGVAALAAALGPAGMGMMWILMVLLSAAAIVAWSRIDVAVLTSMPWSLALSLALVAGAVAPPVPTAAAIVTWAAVSSLVLALVQVLARR